MQSEPGERDLTPSDLAAKAGISQPYASQILSGARTPNVPLAIRIFRATGHKIGPIERATTEEIDTLERFHGDA